MTLRKLLRWPFFLRALVHTNARLSSSFWDTHLCLDYPDMAIHTSRHAILALIDSMLQHHATKPTLINSNVNIRLRLDHVYLGQDARRVLRSPTAGGSSILSEALSVELLTRLLPLRLVKTEVELGRRRGQPMTDYACRFPLLGVGLIGVSVTRAVAYQRRYTKDDASQLMTKKLRAILLTNDRYRFEKHILHVWTESGANASLVRRVCRGLTDDLKSNTVIVVSTVNAESVFFNNNLYLSNTA